MKWIMALLGFFLVAPAAAQSLGKDSDILRPATTLNLQVETSSTSITSPISANIIAVRVVSTVAAHIAVGATPLTATTSDLLLPANVPATFAVRGGDYIAAIRVGSDGNLYITELTR